MAKYLVNKIHVGTQLYYPGDEIDAESQAKVLSAGGNLVDGTTYPAMATAAANALAFRLAGRYEEAAAYMQSAYAEVFGSEAGAASNTLASTAAGAGASLIGIQDAAGIVTATTVEAAIAELKLQKRTVTVGEADLTQAVNGSSQAINIGATLPAKAYIIAADAYGFTPFTGGGATAVKLDIGTAGDVDAVITQADVFAAAVDGGPSTWPRGVRPNKFFSAAGTQLIATFTPDAGGHSLVNLTAGAITVDVLFITMP